MNLLSHLFLHLPAFFFLLGNTFSSEYTYGVYKDHSANKFLALQTGREFFNFTFLDADHSNTHYIYKIQMIAKKIDNYRVGFVLPDNRYLLWSSEKPENGVAFFNPRFVTPEDNLNEYEEIGYEENEPLPEMMKDALALVEGQNQEYLVNKALFVTDLVTKNLVIIEKEKNDIIDKGKWVNLYEVQQSDEGNVILCCVFIELLHHLNQSIAFSNQQIVIYCLTVDHIPGKNGKKMQVIEKDTIAMYRINHDNSWDPGREEGYSSFYLDLGLESNFKIEIFRNNKGLTNKIYSSLRGEDSYDQIDEIQDDDQEVKGKIFEILKSKFDIRGNPDDKEIVQTDWNETDDELESEVSSSQEYQYGHEEEDKKFKMGVQRWEFNATAIVLVGVIGGAFLVVVSYFVCMSTFKTYRRRKMANKVYR